MRRHGASLVLHEGSMELYGGSVELQEGSVELQEGFLRLPKRLLASLPYGWHGQCPQIPTGRSESTLPVTWRLPR